MPVKDIEFQSVEDVIQQIRDMNVKGGSPFGRAAAWAFRLCCEQEKFPDRESFYARLEDIAQQMITLKPTMATIENVRRLVTLAFDSMPQDARPEEIAEAVRNVCLRIIEHSFAAVDALGRFGFHLIFDGATVMMHSYSSALMSVFEHAARGGKTFQVICTESRPLRESRLAVKMLRDMDVKVTYITDAEIWEFLPHADLVIMGADTIGWDGSVANKMGTAMVSQLALACKKPVYIASELFKLDQRTAEGMPIMLERRSHDEVVESDDFEGRDGVEVINQFFDLTPASQIRGLITELGVIAPATVSLYWDRVEKELLQ